MDRELILRMIASTASYVTTYSLKPSVKLLPRMFAGIGASLTTYAVADVVSNIAVKTYKKFKG